MKNLPLILGILIFLGLFYIAYINQTGNIDFLYISNKPAIMMNKGLFIFMISTLSGIAGFLISFSHIMELNYKIKKQTRNVEKAYIETQDSSDKVRALQSKIDTLEMALKEALSGK